MTPEQRLQIERAAMEQRQKEILYKRIKKEQKEKEKQDGSKSEKRPK